MGTILTDDIIERAQVVLNDVKGARWPVADELLVWLNEGQGAFLILKPNAFTKAAGHDLQAGTLQTLPADAIGLFDVPRNLGADGAPGRVVRITLRETMDAADPNWHSSTPNKVVRHFMVSSLDPKRFYVYPPQPENDRGRVELIYPAVPPAVDLGQAIALDDIYAAPLVDYIVYRALLKDSEYAADAGRASAFQAAYVSALTGKARGEGATTANVAAPAAPARAGG